MSPESCGAGAFCVRTITLLLVQGASLLTMTACGQSPEIVTPVPIDAPTPTPDPTTAPPPTKPPAFPTYSNPLPIALPTGGKVESCADPWVMHGQGGDDAWYAYCTSDPLNDADRDASNNYNVHLIPTLKSLDLVNWTYAGDAFTTRPSWAKQDAGIWRRMSRSLTASTTSTTP